MPKPRILFVDDDASALSGLRRGLRSRRDEWDMAFANSGEEALSMLEESGFDVVVSDNRMPGMSGVDLFAEVAGRFPGTARIMLSGVVEKEEIERAEKLTHAFLGKPCSAEEVAAAVESALSAGKKE